MVKEGVGGGRPVILVVEDDDVLRMVLRFEIEKRGFVVREAENGAAALSSFKNRVPDIIVTDLMMPVMDGFSFIDEVRHSAASAGVPIIAISAVKDQEMGRRALALGANTFMAKPLSPEGLLKTIQTYLDASH